MATCVGSDLIGVQFVTGFALRGEFPYFAPSVLRYGRAYLRPDLDAVLCRVWRVRTSFDNRAFVRVPIWIFSVMYGLTRCSRQRITRFKPSFASRSGHMLGLSEDVHIPIWMWIAFRTGI